MAGSEGAGSARVPVDPRASDTEAAAREEAERYGLPFEVALEKVRVSVAKRMAALGRIRAIRAEGQARIAAMDAVGTAAQDDQGAGPEEDEADVKTPPGSAG